MDIHVPACNTIQPSVLRQIKSILVHPTGNVQLAFRNYNVVSYHTGTFGNFKDIFSCPLNSNLKCIPAKSSKSNHLVNRVVTFSNLSLPVNFNIIMPHCDENGLSVASDNENSHFIQFLPAIIQAFLRL